MPQVPVGNFAQEPTGDLIFARGDQVMKRWDGLLADFVQAGIASPSAAIGVAASTDGSICGTIYAVVRYLDVEGRVSNVSPLSTALTIAVSSKSVEDASNEDPIEVISTAHGLSTGDRIKISGVRGNYAANGTWTVTVSDVDTFTLNNSLGSGLYTGGGTMEQGAGQIDYTSIPDASAITNVFKKQILRSKDGDANTFYLDLDSEVDASFDLNTTSKSSTKTDAQLGASIVLIDILGNDLNQSRHGLPPGHKRCVIHHLSRMFMAGDSPHNQGVVTLTNGSPTVVGIDTNFTSEMSDWELYPLGTSNTKSYTVSSLNTGTQTLTLDENYAGTTAPYARYELRKPGAERRSLWFSEASLPHSFDPLKVLTLPEDPLAGEITGLMSYRLFIYILFEHRMYRFSYAANPDEDGQVFKDHYRGCLNQHCWQIIEETAYLMDDYGIYLFAGNFNEPISVPIQPLFDRNSDSEFKIRWENKEHFHSVHDPSEEVVRWFVCLDGSRYPRHALAYHYRHRRWWIEEFPFGIASSYLGFLDTPPQVFLGAEGRRVLALGHGTLDGAIASNGTVRGTATSSGVNTLTDTSATFDTTGLAGLPVRIVSGKGAGQSRIISSATATKLTVKNPWMSLPDTTSVYQVGGFEWRYKTGWMTWAEDDVKSKRALKLQYKPMTEASYLEYRIYEDSPEFGRDAAINAGLTKSSTELNGIAMTEGDPERVVDTTKVSGFVAEYMDRFSDEESDRARQVQFEFRGVPNKQTHQIEQVTVEGAE
jgi:hypothetical protein